VRFTVDFRHARAEALARMDARLREAAAELASGAGHDLRVVVVRRGEAAEAVAVTRRTAPAGTFVTNRPGAVYTDEPPGTPLHRAAATVACAAVDALGLQIGGVDVIEHDGDLRRFGSLAPSLAGRSR